MEETTHSIYSILKVNAGDTSMMIRCTAKTRLHNLEPEDLRALTLSTAEITGIPLVGKHSK